MQNFGENLKQKWSELNLGQTTSKLKEKMSKTIYKAMKKAGEALTNPDSSSWKQSLDKVQANFQSKWDGLFTEKPRKNQDYVAPLKMKKNLEPKGKKPGEEWKNNKHCKKGNCQPIERVSEFRLKDFEDS